MEVAGTPLRTVAGIAALVAIAFALVFVTRMVLGLDESTALILIAVLLFLPSAVSRLFTRRA